MNKDEYIGKVKLDYTHYPGTDLYSDGAVEQAILNAVTASPPSAYPDLIETSRDWSYLYHLSHLRHNITDWLPINKTHKILEIGSGCGAITGNLAEKAGQVICIDLSETRSKINAQRHKDYDNITIHIGNFADIEPDLPNDFDFVLFIGVFEYCCLYIKNNDPYVEMLRIAKNHLKPDGHIAIAIENRFGLKYWAGCTEDHLGTYFSGLEDYPHGGHARTFTQPQFIKMLTTAGIEDYHFYYPYPDYKFMTTLFSENRLPQIGELYDNNRNFDRHRMELFNERKVFDSIINDEVFPLFSNSYFIYTGKAPDTAYLRYSNDRAPKYRIRTMITKDKKVIKTPLTTEAEEHANQMLESYRLLLNQYKDTTMTINKCQPAPDGKSIEFEYIDGITLAEKLDECLKNGETAIFDELLDKFKVIIEQGDSSIALNTSYTGESCPRAKLNHDLIFTNILIDKNNHDKWTLIDYEWMMEAPITPKETLYRALYCYLLEDESRKTIDPDSLSKKWGITPDDIKTYRLNERKFQDLVAGGLKSIAEMRVDFGLMTVDPKKLIEPYIKRAPGRHVQIFFDTGNGFSEIESIHLLDAYQNENDVLVDITIPTNTRKLRIDPADAACIIKIHNLNWNNETKTPISKHLRTNGRKLHNNCYIFKTTDPQLHLPIKKSEQGDKHLSLKLEVVFLPIKQ